MTWSNVFSYIPSISIFLQASTLIIIPAIFVGISNRIFKKMNPPQQHAQSNKISNDIEVPSDCADQNEVTGNLQFDLNNLKNEIGQNSDVHFRHFNIKSLKQKATLVYVEGMQTTDFVNLHILKPLMTESANFPYASIDSISTHVKENLLPVIHVEELNNLSELGEIILYGYTALLINNMSTALLVGTPNVATRAIDEPKSEILIRGPHLGFTEDINTNTSLLRRHGKNKNLVITTTIVGNTSKKELVTTYMKDIINEDLLQEVTKRIQNLNYDHFPESGYIEQLMEDNSLSPFQQFQVTERPDKVIAALLEGRIAILLDGTSNALIAPTNFTTLVQSPEDYYERWTSGSFIRMLRFFSIFLAIFTPALYIAFISFHVGLIPTQLALTIIEKRQHVPFPALLEVLILEISIEILRESSIRLPQPIGPAMGIVGGLIVGEAAVQAGIVSPFIITVVGLTAISSFTIPDYSAGITLRLLRFIAMLFSAVLGLYGTTLFVLILCAHLLHLRSFGLPYLSPVAPTQWHDYKDLFIRSPLAFMIERPRSLKTQKRKRI